MPLFEVLEVRGEARQCLALGREADLRRVAARNGFVPLLEQVKAHVLAGTIAVEEAYRTCYFGDAV